MAETLTITMKQHDLLPITTLVILEPDPNNPGEDRPVDLTAASSAKLNAMIMGGVDTFTATLAFGTRSLGQVVWTPVAGDTDTDGIYDAEVEVTWSAKPETYPNDGYFTIHIVKDLG